MLTPERKPLPERHDDGTECVFTERQIAEKLQVKVRAVKALIRKGQLGCKVISPRIRRVSAKHYNDYVNGTETWPTKPQSTASSLKTGGSTNPPRSTPTGESSGTTVLPSRHVAFLLAQSMIRKDT